MNVVLHRPNRGEVLQCHFNPPARLAYLAGPIIGTPNFRDEATSLLAAQVPPGETLHIANPFWQDIAPGRRLHTASQRAWERYHYRTACSLGNLGVVLFYFGRSNTAERSGIARSIQAENQWNRRVFTEALSLRRASAHPVTIALGIDPERTGPLIDECRTSALAADIEVYTDLEATCTAAASALFQPHEPAGSAPQ